MKTVLEEAGYQQIESTTGLWKHCTRKTRFALGVDDFGVKYFNQQDADHFIKTLQKHYAITIVKKRITLLWVNIRLEL